MANSSLQLNMNRRRFVRIAASTTIAGGVALSAASRRTPMVRGVSAAAPRATLTWWTVEPGNPQAAAQQAAYVQGVEQALNIKLDVQNVPFPQFDSKSQAALAAGQGPDLLSVNSVTVGAFAERGYLRPTNDFLSGSTKVKEEDFFPGLWGHVVYKGQTYGLPMDTGTRALYYNIAYLQEKGVEPPRTQDDLKAALPKLTDPGKGIYGITYSGGEKWVWLYEALGMLTVPNGHEFLAPDLAKGLVAEQVLPDLQWWVEVHKNGWAPTEAITSNNPDERYTQFAQGRAATVFAGHWAREALIANQAPEFGVVNVQGSKGIGSSTGGWTMMITKDSQQPEAAWEVMEHTFGSPDVLATLTNIMPATKAANELVLTDPFYQPFKEVLQTNAKHPVTLNPALPEMAEILRTESQAAILGSKAIEQAAQDTDRQFLEALQSFG